MKFGTNDLSYVCLGKKVVKVVIIKRNQKKEKSIRSIRRNQKKKKINKKNTSRED